MLWRSLIGIAQLPFNPHLNTSFGHACSKSKKKKGYFVKLNVLNRVIWWMNCFQVEEQISLSGAMALHSLHGLLLHAHSDCVACAWFTSTQCTANCQQNFLSSYCISLQRLLYVFNLIEFSFALARFSVLAESMLYPYGLVCHLIADCQLIECTCLLRSALNKCSLYRVAHFVLYAISVRIPF